MKCVFTFIISLLGFATICSAQLKQDQQAEIARFIENYEKAWNHKDKAVLEYILAPDYVYFSSTGQVGSRQAVLEEFMSPKYILESAERSELKVYGTSGAAVVSSRWQGRGTLDGREFHDDQRYSIFLAAAKKEWLVLSEHCTQIAP